MIIAGIENADMIQVLSGIDEGDKVIVSGKDYLSETSNDIIIKKEND